MTLLALAILVLDVTPAVSQRPADLLALHVCIQDFVKVRPLDPIPVGCEVIDCCPGCPGDAPIDWRVRLAGDAVTSVVLEFENLPTTVRERLSIRGPARWLDDRRLEITAGEVLVRGFPRTRSDRPPVAVPRILGREVRGREPRPFEFSVEQLVRAVRVATFNVQFHLVDCHGVPPVGPDVISLKNNASGDNAVVLLDAQRDAVASCPVSTPPTGSDEVWRGAGDILIGNALARHTCNSEVVVFSQNHAMQLVEDVTTWTDATGDRLDVSLAQKLAVPIAVWVVHGPFTNPSNTGVGDHAAAHVQRADVLYGSMNCGVVVAGTVHDSTNLSPPPMLQWRCSQAATLRALAGFTPGVLNAYYVAEVARDDTGGLVRGAACGFVLPSPTVDDHNTLLVSTLHMDAESLAHEMGHGFSLRDRKSQATAVDPNFLPTTNLMASGGSNRHSLTEGQCLRVNVNPESVVNRTGIRVGPTRSCPDAITSATCPPLKLDIDPNN